MCQAKILFTLILFFFVKNTSFSQCDNSYFINDTICSSSSVELYDSSTTTISHYWDFYPLDFETNTVITEDLGNIPNTLSDSWGVSVVQDSNGVHVFNMLKTKNEIYRSDFLADFSETVLPNAVNLGNPYSLANPNNPQATFTYTTHGFEFYENNAFITTGSSYANFRLLHYKFSNGLSLPPDTFFNYANTSTANYELKNPKNLRIIKDNTDSIFLFVMNANYITVMSFGNHIDSTPIYMHKIENLNGLNSTKYARDIDIVRVCDKWLGYAVLDNQEIIRLDFGNKLSNMPTISNLGNPNNIIAATAYNIKSFFEDGKVYVFAQLVNGSIIKFDFGADGLAVPIDYTYPLALLNGSTISFDMIKIESTWFACSYNRTLNKFVKVRFPNGVMGNSTSSEDTISSLPYTTPGLKYISVNSKDANGNSYSYLDSIFLVESLAIDFELNSQCLDNPIEFSGIGDSTLENYPISWDWDFDNGTTASTQNSNQTLNPGLYDVNLTVNSNKGCSSTLTKSLEFSNLKPENPDFNFSPDIICENTLIDFNNISTTVSDTIKAYYWDFGDGNTSTAENPQHQYSVNGTYTVSLTVAGIYGCDTTITQQITVNPGPTPLFSYDKLCLNSESTFTDNSFSPANSSIVSWKWDFDYIDTSNLQNPGYTFLTTGSHLISLTVATDSGCVATIDSTINIKELPEVKFEYPVVCKDLSNEFVGFSSDSIVSWKWYVDSQFTDNSQSTNLIFTDSLEHQIKLIVVDANGCTDSITKQIEVFPALNADFSFTNNCVGDSVSFTDETASFSVVNRKWTFNSFLNSYLENPKVRFTTAGPQQITLAIENAIGCKSSVTKTVDIVPQPIASFGFDKICENDKSLFYDNSLVVNDSVIRYSWIIDTTYYSLDSVKHNFYSPQSFNIHFAISTANGCKDDTTATLNVNANPIPDFDFTPNYGTAPLEVSFENLTPEAVSFAWTFGDSAGISILENPVYTYNENGIYNITLTAINEFNCAASQTQTIAVIPSDLDIELKNLSFNIQENSDNTISINPKLEIRNVGTRIITDAELVLSINQETNFVQNWEEKIPIGGAMNYTFDGYFLISDLSISKYICVEAINVNDNTEKNLTNNKICALLDGLVQFSAPYPNPANDNVFIDIITREKGSCSVQVFNILGENITKQQNVPLKKGYNQININSSLYQSGKYIVVIKYLDENYNKQFVIK